MESRPVFADPSGRRHQILRFAGFGSMAAIGACLVSVVVAMTGGPQAPFTQWAAPQATATAKHNPQQAGTRPFDHATVGGTVGSRSGGGTGPGQPAPGTSTTATPGSSPSGGKSAQPSPSAGSTPSPTTTATVVSTSSPTATGSGRGKSSGRGNPHSTASPTPTA